MTGRRKGSLNNITLWTPALRAAVGELVSLRKVALKRRGKDKIQPMRPEDRPLLVAQDGGPLQKSSLESAWQRLRANAIAAGVIHADESFSLHGIKHRGITDTKGTRAEKKDASGHRTEAAFSVYDHELKSVNAATIEEGKT
jgi:hypothetical protein